MHFKQSCNPRTAAKLPGKLTHEDVYKMMMLHRYQRKSCNELARQFGITRAQAYDLIARRQVGGCCG